LRCAISFDLDEIGHYHAIHGLPPPGPAVAHAVHRLALPRLGALARRLDLPLTLFTVGADLAVEGNTDRLRSLVAEGHEIGNHSLEHRYDLVRLHPAEQRRQIASGRELLQRAIGAPVLGFRAPGYTVDDPLLDLVASAGHRYDSSVFPCPPYLLAKWSVLAWMALRRRPSASIPGDPKVIFAPVAPYHPEVPYWRGAAAPGSRGLLELPIQVTPRGRLPVIGTALMTLPWAAAAGLLRACAGQPLLNLEFHGIDVLGAEDGLEGLARRQPDLNRSTASKMARFERLIGWLKGAGYRFSTLGDAAVQLGA
jgi:peptidoglycan/xylan/chitin deacetylase (PgdA/CDA1 family)